MYSEKLTSQTPQKSVNKEQMPVSDFDKTLLFSCCEYFLQKRSPKSCWEKYFLKIQPKWKPFLKFVNTMFQILKKTLQNNISDKSQFVQDKWKSQISSGFANL